MVWVSESTNPFSECTLRGDPQVGVNLWLPWPLSVPKHLSWAELKANAMLSDSVCVSVLGPSPYMQDHYLHGAAMEKVQCVPT